jgi:hypothetical protein
MNRRIRSYWLIATLLATMAFGLSASNVSGASLEGYRARVASALKGAAEIEAGLKQNEIHHSGSRQFVEQIRRDFPTSERLEWFGGSVETSNEWLLSQTTDFEKEADLVKRLPIMSAIREHLSALSYKFDELDRRAEETRTKDEDRQKLGEILRREEYQKPQQSEESAFQRWLRRVLEWFLDQLPKPSSPGQSLSGMEGLAAVLRVLLYVGIFAVVLFGITKLAFVLFPNLRRTPKPKKKKSRVILGEQIAEDQGASDLFSEAESLAREGDLRGAIRKGYIALLCDLSDRNVIGLARNKTNRDYLRDVRSRSELHRRMQSVTEQFERHWYGIQKSEAKDWTRFSEEYREAIRSV